MEGMGFRSQLTPMAGGMRKSTRKDRQLFTERNV